LGQESPSTEQGVLGAADRLEELLSDSGLLLPRDGKRGGFYHFSFQEFLAAERFAVLAVDQGAEAWYALFLSRGPTAEWRYTLDFLFGAYLFRHASTQAGIRLLRCAPRRAKRGRVVRDRRRRGCVAAMTTERE